jgi:hypothetical protein
MIPKMVSRATTEDSARRPLLPDELEEVLPKYQHALADLMKRQPFAPEHAPCCLPDS